VLCSLSGIFRDAFANVVDLLDDLFEAAAAADEPPERNFVRANALALGARGVDRPAARLFSNPPGDFGSMVNERVGNGEWDAASELGDTWVARNSFAYGRRERGERAAPSADGGAAADEIAAGVVEPGAAGAAGASRPEVLEALLATTDRIAQEVDSVEYGLTDIQEYYANTGALRQAANDRNVGARARGGVRVSVIEATAGAGDVAPRDLEQLLRVEYRSKLLNPKWAEAMASQGGGGAYEISQRMTAMVGWAAVSRVDQFVFDGAAERYALDTAMAERLRAANPEAFKNVVRRLLEAAGRGMWDADDAVLERLRDLYAEADDTIEGVGAVPPLPEKTGELAAS
jgi:magnesium chelatase subunit H